MHKWCKAVGGAIARGAGWISNTVRKVGRSVLSFSAKVINKVTSFAKGVGTTIATTVQRGASYAYKKLGQVTQGAVRLYNNVKSAAGQALIYTARKVEQARQAVQKFACGTAKFIGNAIKSVNWKKVGKVITIGAAAAGATAAIIFTAGAATPVVVSAAGYAAAAGTGAFAAADIQSEITDGKHNYIRDTVFRGNQKTYNTAHSIVDVAGMAYVAGGAVAGKAAKTGTTGAKAGTSIKNNVKSVKSAGNVGNKERITNRGKLYNNYENTSELLSNVEYRNGKYYADKTVIDEIGKIESKGEDFSLLEKKVMSFRNSSEGGTSIVYKYSDKSGTKYLIHEVTDDNGRIIHRDFDAVRILSGQLINKGY